MRIVIAALALLLVGAAPVRDWNAVVSRTQSGSYVVGNPAAKVKLIEYISYTCPHCAAFATQSAATLRGQMVRSGSTSVEYRNVVREKLDLTAALLARCAGPRGFLGVHDALFAQQGDWFERGYNFQRVNDARIGIYPPLAQFRAYADGAGLSDLIRAAGMSGAAVDSCFATDADLNRLLVTSDTASRKINGTPSFEVDGKLIEDADWAKLEPMLRAAGAH